MNSSQTTDDDLRTEGARVQRRVAAANDHLSDAVFAAAGIGEPGHRIGAIVQTHEELLDAYRSISRAVEWTDVAIRNADSEYGSPTPREITNDHAERLKEQYDGPVLNLALMLLEHNRRKWLHRKRETNGAETVERHGLTENQRTWLNELREAWGAYDAE